MHIYYLQKSTFSLVFIYNLHITNLKHRKQLHYILCKIQVCYLGRISDSCPHLQVLKSVCVTITRVLLAAVHLIFVRTGGMNNTYIRFTDDSLLAFWKRCGCLCRKAVFVHFLVDVLARNAHVRLYPSQQRHLQERKQLNALFLNSEFLF